MLIRLLLLTIDHPFFVRTENLCPFFACTVGRHLVAVLVRNFSLFIVSGVHTAGLRRLARQHVATSLWPP